MAFIARGRTREFLSVYGEPLLPRIIKFIVGGLTGRLQMNIQSSEGSFNVYLELLNGLPIICIAIQASRPIVGIDCLDIIAKIECANCLVEVLELGSQEVNVDVDYVKSYYGQNAIISKEQAITFIERAKRLLEQLEQKRVTRKTVRETAARPTPKSEHVRRPPKLEKKPAVQPKPAVVGKQREVREEVERRERKEEKEKQQLRKPVEGRELEVKAKHVGVEREHVEIPIASLIDDISKELLNPLLLVKLLTLMEFISGFTGSTREFLKRICEISKSIPEAVYIARIRVGSKIYRIAAANGKIMAAAVEEGNNEVYGKKALEALLKEKTVVASIARVPIDMLPDKARKAVVEEHSTNQQDKSSQELQDVSGLTHQREEINE